MKYKFALYCTVPCISLTVVQNAKRHWHVSDVSRFVICAVEGAGKKGNLYSVFNLKFFVQAANFWWPIQKSVRPPNFPPISYDPLEPLCCHAVSHPSCRVGCVPAMVTDFSFLQHVTNEWRHTSIPYAFVACTVTASYIYIPCGAAVQHGSWPPHSSGL